MPRHKPTSPEESLKQRMMRLGIKDQDLEERFVRGSGPGGQKINKTASCVQLTHRPTMITVICQDQRSQFQNRLSAKKALCDKIEALQQQQKLKESALASKARRQQAKRSRGTKEDMLRYKKLRSKAKQLRRSVERD